MQKLLALIAENPKSVIAALLIAAAIGARTWHTLAVDVFPDISVPRVTIQTEAGGLNAEEVEQRVTIPIESVMNGIPGVTTLRSSSSGSLSFVWVDFDWKADLTRARFDVFERLSRVADTLPENVHTEISPIVSVTGEIMLVALTAENDAVSALDLREFAEYDLRTRLLGIPGIGEVAVIGGRLPEYRIAVEPRTLADRGLTLFDILEAARDTRTYLSAGYLADVRGEEVPLRQIARADTLDALQRAPLPHAGGALRLRDVATVSVCGAPRRGSASFNGKNAVVLSVQKAPGGNTPALTRALDQALEELRPILAAKGIALETKAYRQADFIQASIAGGGRVIRDAVIIVIAVLLLTLLELRTLLIVLCTMPLSVFLGLMLFPLFGLGINVMTLGGFAVAAGDIVDAAIIFTEVIRRKLAENAARAPAEQRPRTTVIAEAAGSVAPGVLFSTLIVLLVFIPLLLLTGLEGQFFRPLALSYICIFSMSLLAAWTLVPALARLLRLGARPASRPAAAPPTTSSRGLRLLGAVYRQFLSFALSFPKTVLLLALVATALAIRTATGFGSSFLPSFREDSFNVMVSLPPGASLAETERIAEGCVPALSSVPGVLSVTRRTGRAERDQHAEPVSSSEFVVRVDLARDTDAIRRAIRERLADLPGCAIVVGYPIAHRISAVLSGTEAELAINLYGDDADTLRETVAKMKNVLEHLPSLTDVRANREITVRTLRIDYRPDALVEAGLTAREAGEQVAAAFNGADAGEVRDGLRRRAVVVRLAGDENALTPDDVRALLLFTRAGRCVRLDEVARVIPEESPNLLLREGGRRKALISCNPAPGVDTGRLVEELRARLAPIAAEAGCTLSFGGSYQARESAGRQLAFLGLGLLALVFFLLAFALGSSRAAFLTLLNVPLGLVGSVAAVAWAHPVLSVSSLVGFVTVIGFVLRNGILLINCYRERLNAGASLAAAIREGSEERMVPIVLTSLTTVIGLIPIMLAGNRPGGELLAPLAIVQFGGLLGATILNLIVLPAAASLFGIGGGAPRFRRLAPLAAITLTVLAGCRSYTPTPVDWERETPAANAPRLTLSAPDDAAALALVGNRSLNTLRLKAAGGEALAREAGWWEDPSLELDLLRIVNPADHPFLGGGGLAFSLPLSGLPACEKRAAEALSRAEKADILDAERTVAATARQLALRLAALRQQLALLTDHERDARLRRAREAIEKLHLAGEVSTPERASVRRTLHARQHAAMETERAAAETEIELLHHLGLRPGARIETAFTLAAPPLRAPAPLDPRRLTAHPRVVAALARHDAGEAGLDAEIRRQYPALTLGPAAAREEGLNRLGLVAGLTLPLWNRNRKGIAEAARAESLAHQEALETWRALVTEAARTHATLTHLLAHPSLPPSEKREADLLADAGELTPLDYFTVREELLDQKLSELEWKRDVALTLADYSKLTQGEEK